MTPKRLDFLIKYCFRRRRKDVPVAATFPLADVRAAFRQLEQGNTRGKIVLAP
jgi:NADPH:quinone reductase-like Zn-dependent oxidoreductase